MDIVVIGAEITDEQGLGPCYRIVQRSPQGVELYVLPRSAVAADMEMYGVDDPLHVLDWRLHGYRGASPRTPHVEPSLPLIAQVQRAQAFAEYRRRAAVGAEHPHALVEVDLDQVDDEIDRLRAEARRLRDAEVAQIKANARVVDDDGLAALRALVLADVENIAADRQRYRQQLGESLNV
ncbi:hypothetical protein [Saccharothrix deserti]|uniref:hypothetical protein n=1 Tax=Saccharothrix deserti TaxID=2593674 RepID=UPI00131E651F|nr:hypothetical protein [Saccharothrix deserti]